MQSYRQHLQNKFIEEYERLNVHQKLAVDTIEGPVIVIAGPGTGKTQILAARIGKILLETDASPENILCLTYTDAGAIAMRRRLIQFIGADAYKVNIHTFHSFCNDIIQENLSLFEKNSLDPVSDLEIIELFKILIDSFPKNNPLKRYRGDVYFEINNLRNLFDVMKREGWSPSFIHKKITEYLDSLAGRENFIAKKAWKEFKKGDVRTDWIGDENTKMEKLRAAVNEFDHFQQLMRQRNRYDFNDMINWVIDVFENNHSVLSNYQEKYQYILVDEYQDTSGTQNRLVRLLISYWDRPNIFVVGDDDQSIFRFQGANVANMQEFTDSYTDNLMKVVLTNNYRSVQGILDVSKTLIERNEERLINKMPGLSKDLVSSNELIRHLAHQPSLHEYQTSEDEMIGITNQINELIKQNVAPSKMAVIYKEHTYGTSLSRYLQLKKIPTFSKRTINVLEDPFARKLIMLLRWLAEEHDIPYAGDELLFEILHFDFYTIPPIEIAKLAVEVNKRKYDGENTSIRRLLLEKIKTPPKDLFDRGLPVQLKQVAEMLEHLVADVSNCTLQQLFENLVKESGALNYIIKSPDKINLLNRLTALFDFIKVETSRNPQLTLEALINIIDLMQAENISLPLLQVSGSDKGVNLLTAHGSKGLEFEYVFFAGCNASYWEKKKKPGGGYRFPDNLFTSIAAGSDVEELRRLFYVALTRAQQQLYISYSLFNGNAKEIERTMFIEEILEKHPLGIEKIYIDEEVRAAYDILKFTTHSPEIEKAEDDFINPLLEKFVMNVTALNNYLRCPIEFYYKSLVRIPSGKSEATEFGSAIHYALEKLFRKMSAAAIEKKDAPFAKVEQLVEDFRWYMLRHRQHFTKEAFARRLEYGEEVLGNYYTTYINSWNKIVVTERNFRAMVGEVPIKGKIDKLEFMGKDVNVVDYKSGNFENALEKMKSPNDKNPLGGDYWRQAVFYKILLENYTAKDWNVVSTEFDFIEPDKNKKYQKVKIFIQAPDIETVKQQLVDVWKKIQAKEFYTGCGKEKCQWCNFIKDNRLAIALHEQEEEEET